MKAFTKKIVLLICFAFIIIGCNKEEIIIDNSVSESMISGTVSVPENSTIDVNSLRISSPFDMVTISDGTFTMSTMSDKFLTQLVSTSSGEVMLLGFSFPGQTNFEVNSKSTALAMLMNLPTSLIMTPEGKLELIEVILNHPDFLSLVNEIDSLLLENKSPLDLLNESLAISVGKFYEKLFSTVSKTIKREYEEDNYPVEILRVGRELTFVNPGKSYDTKIGIYKDEQAIQRLSMDRINFFPTGIGDVIGAIGAAATGDIPSGLEPVEDRYTLVGDGKFEIKVRNGFYTNGLDPDNVSAYVSNMIGWSLDLIVEILPIDDCAQPLIANFKEFAQTALAFQETPSAPEVLGLLYNLISEFLTSTLTITGCLLVENEDTYLRSLSRLTYFTGLVGLLGNVFNSYLGIYQWIFDDGALDKCYEVNGDEVTECNDADVYVVGYEKVNGIKTAKMWKNGVVTSLTDGMNNSSANSIYVTNNNAYVVGNETILGQGGQAKLWKNGVNVYSDNFASANSVFVSDNEDVYMVGSSQENKASLLRATVWKNGVATYLTDGSHNAHANSVFISENDVYVVGYEAYPNRNVALLWKNGTPIILEDSIYAQPTSLFVSGNDIYVAGLSYDGANVSVTVWKNGNPFYLTNTNDHVRVYSIYVSEGDVYLAGSERLNNNLVATVWKNGEAIHLSDEISVAKSIYISNNEVFVCGAEVEGDLSMPVIWKNGIKTTLDYIGGDAIANSIFVK